MRPRLSVGSLSTPRCLRKGFATSCSYPGLLDFRQPTYTEAIATQGAKQGRQHRQSLIGVEVPPLFKVLRRSPDERRGTQRAPRLELLTLGVGPFQAAAQRIEIQAKELGVFSRVHAYTNFSFITPRDEQRYAQHLHAWRQGRARIAGFGWWKPVLCRRHLAATPKKTGLLAFSDAGSWLLLHSLPTWLELLKAMRHFD